MSRKIRTTVIVAVAVCLIAAVTVGYWLWPKPSEEEARPPARTVVPAPSRAPAKPVTDGGRLDTVGFGGRAAPTPVAQPNPRDEGATEGMLPETARMPVDEMRKLLALHTDGAATPVRREVAARTATNPDVEALAENDRRYVIRLKSRALLPGKGTDIAFAGKSKVVLLQFWRRPDIIQERALREQGVQLLQPTTGNAMYARVSRDTFPEALDLGFVRGAAPLTAEDKISPLASEIELDSHAITETGLLRLVWRGHKGTAQDGLLAAAAGIDGVTIHGRAGRDNAVFVDATDAGMRALAELDITHWIEPVAPPAAAMNVQAAQASGVDVLYGAPNNLTGAGVNVMVLDGGAVRDTHVDLVGRVTGLEAQQPSGGPYGDHATHVAGTIAGTGTSNAAARGMATSAQLFSYSFFSGLIEEQVDKLEDALQTYGCILSNHSWGYTIGYRWDAGNSQWVMGASEGLFGLYTGVSADWDEAIYEDGLMVVKAAGNDRNNGPDGSNHDGTQAGDGEYYDLIGPLAGVKNAITVGAASDAAFYWPPNDGITTFTCFGPTDDGRLKPEIVFNGDDLLSSGAASDSTVVQKSGTSMATPGVTGTIALLVERYNTRFGSYPSTAWLRAVLTSYATDLGRTGPDYQYGYGILDAEATLAALNEHDPVSLPHWLHAAALWDSSTPPYQNVHLLWKNSDAAFPLVVNCAWIDEPGDPAAAQALVNDLDIWVSPFGDPATKYYPWSLGGLAAPDAPATWAGRNSVDNIEQVLVAGLASGWYVVNVEAYSGVASYCLASYEWLHPANATTDDASEDNDASGSPAVFASFPAVANNLRCFDDDWFSFDVPSAGPLGVYVLFADANGPLSLTIYDATYALVASLEGTSNPSENSGIGAEYVLCNALAGTYYVKVSGYGGATNNHYSFIAIQPTIDTNLAVRRVKVRSVIQIGDTTEVDVKVQNSGWGQSAACSGEIRLSSDSTIDGSDRLLTTFAIPALKGFYYAKGEVSVTIPGDVTSGSWYIGAIADSGGVVAESDETDNAGSAEATIIKPDDGYENNDVPADATLVALNATYIDLVCYDLDWYKVQPATDATLTARIEFLNANGNLGLALLDSTLTPVAVAEGENDAEEVTSALTAGTYYIVVAGESAEGSAPAVNDDYTLRIGYGTAPSFTSTAVTSVQAGSTYSYIPTASGTPAPTITASGVPAWLTWDGTSLSGTPGGGDVGTTSDITLTTSSGVSPDATQVFQITVSAAPSNGDGGGGCAPGGGSAMLPAFLLFAAILLRKRRG